MFVTQAPWINHVAFRFSDGEELEALALEALPESEDDPSSSSETDLLSIKSGFWRLHNLMTLTACYPWQALIGDEVTKQYKTMI